MASNDKQLFITLDGQQLEIASAEEAPVSITYQVEDIGNFEQKKSSRALSIAVPATGNNQKLINSFHNPSAEDLTTGGIYRKPRECCIVAANIEVLKGQAMLVDATHTGMPESYSLDCVGSNGDWMLDLQETTLFDLLPATTHLFTFGVVQASWYGGALNTFSEYVYAPVRYKKRFGANADDLDVSLMDLRPSLYVFTMIWKAFQSVGYSISSEFFNTEYFQRQVLPWVWGDFLSINSKLAEMLQFKASGPVPLWASGSPTYFTQLTPSSTGSGTGIFYPGSTGSFYDDFELSNANPTFGFDNNNNYSYDSATGESRWTYNTVNGKDFGTITARFGVSTVGGILHADFGSNASIYIDVYKNGTLINSQQHYNASAGSFSSSSDVQDNRVYNFSVSGLNPGDTVSIYFRYTYFKSAFGNVSIGLFASEITSNTPPTYRQTTFQLYGISIDPGGIVDFSQYDAFKNYKFLDMLRGIVDFYDLEIDTDSVNRIVVIEPSHDYDLNDGVGIREGYFNSKQLDWSSKQDMGEESKLSLYSDSERILAFKYKPDGSNGGINIYNKRYNVEAGAAKYLFSERFKKGKRELVNRFFAAPIHYNADQFKMITGISPQFMAFISENVANTSANESEQVFEPVLAYYKGLVSAATWGGWSFEGNTGLDLPFMFAVNYRAGGADSDPILTYSDQAVEDPSGVVVLGQGLLTRFFLPRMAIIEYGKLYETWIKLNNNDVTNWFHREAIVINGANYHLIKIEGYRPLLPVPTKCTFWKHTYPTTENLLSCYPSQNSVLTNPLTLSAEDIRYARLLLLTPDIP